MVGKLDNSFVECFRIDDLGKVVLSSVDLGLILITLTTFFLNSASVSLVRSTEVNPSRFESSLKDLRFVCVVNHAESNTFNSLFTTAVDVLHSI